MFKIKLKAFLTHLAISTVIIGILLSFIFLYWYPSVFAYIAGLSTIIIIMVAIDLVLGPALTFILYKPKKPGLLLDLSLIAIFQVAALAYATHTIYEGHPLYVTYAVDRFTLVTANDVNPEKAVLDTFKKSKLTGPMLAYAQQPDDPKEAQKILFEVLAGAPDIDKRPELYKPIEKHLNEIFAKSINPEKLLKHDSTKKELMKFVKQYGSYETFALLPLSGQSKDVIWALDKKTGKPIDIININPWSMSVNL